MEVQSGNTGQHRDLQFEYEKKNGIQVILSLVGHNLEQGVQSGTAGI